MILLIFLERLLGGQAMTTHIHPNFCRLPTLFAALLGGLLVAGCADLDERSSRKLGAAEDKPRPAATQPPATNRFTIEPGSDLVGYLAVVPAQRGDTMMSIARRFDVGYNELRDANPYVAAVEPQDGIKVLIPKRFILPEGPRRGIVLNLAMMRLFYFPPTPPGEKAVVETHPVGIGREGWRTPEKTTRIAHKVVRPTWYPPQSIIEEHAAEGDNLPAAVLPGPDNPLGEYAMRLALSSYLIHGTNKPDGIGMRVSHGCVQMFPEDIESLFKQVPAGTEVRIINEPFLTGFDKGELYFEGHYPLEEQAQTLGASAQPALDRVRQAAAKRGIPESSIDWLRLEHATQNGLGFPVSAKLGGVDEETLRAEAPEYPPTNAKVAATSAASTSVATGPR
jgi:L,D-transpeptidase ErfK/SrfK